MTSTRLRTVGERETGAQKSPRPAEVITPSHIVADEKTRLEAASRVAAALAVPDARRHSLAWADRHPEIALHLRSFANITIDRVDESAQKYDADNSGRESRERSGAPTQLYELARDALRLADKLDPASPNTQRLLATTEAFFGEYSNGGRPAHGTDRFANLEQ